MVLRKIWRKCKKAKYSVIERRKYLRLDAAIPIKYAVITKDKHTIAHPAEHQTNSKNIGGGGLMIEIPLLEDEFLMTKNLLKVEIALPDNSPPVQAIAKTVCIEKDDSEDIYYLRLQFMEISEQDRRRIIDFVTKGLEGK